MVISAPLAGSLKLTTTVVPLTGPAVVLGAAKHLDFARVGNRWYKMVGDHAATTSPEPGVQDGNQEIYSFNVPANDWRLDQPYYVPDATKIQASDPDDGFVITRGGEIWYFFSVTNRPLPLTQPTGNFATLIQPNAALMAWTPGGSWRKAGPWPSLIAGDRAWRGFHDPVKDRFIIPVDKNGAVWGLIDGKTGADFTLYSGGVPIQYGDFIFSVAGCAVDAVKRRFYCYDLKTSALYAMSVDAPGVPVRVANLPEPMAKTEAAIKLCWHPTLRAVVVAASQLHAYEVDSNKLTTWARPDGFINGAAKYVPTSTIFYDPDSGDVVSIGTIDWDTGMNPRKYWRLRIS